MNIIFLESPELHIAEDSIIIDMNRTDTARISVASGCHVRSIAYGAETPKSIRTYFLGSDTVFDASSVVYGADRVQQLSVIIEGTNTKAQVNLLGLACTGDHIRIDGIGRVEKGSEQIELRVDQEVLLLGETASVQGRPILEIATDSITGGHSTKIHRISGDALFYLESHGLSRAGSEGLLIDGLLSKHLGISLDIPELHEAKKNILSHIHILP